MQLENLPIGSVLAVPSIGVIEATLLDVCGGYAKVKVTRGRFADAGPQTWAPGTDVKPLRYASNQPSDAAVVSDTDTVSPVTEEIPMSETNGKFTPNAQQHKILVGLAKAERPYTRSDIVDEVYKGTKVNLKPIIAPLIEHKLVKEKTREVAGKNETSYEIMAPGKKAALLPAPVARVRGEAVHQPLPKIGSSFSKTFKEKEHTVKVVEGGFEYQKKVYTSISATAKAVRESDTEVNGWAFFGLTK